MKRILLAGVILALAGCEAPDTKQLIEGDLVNLQRKLDTVNARLEKAEKTLGQTAQKADESDRTERQARADQSVLVEDLRVEINTLKGAMDVLRHDVGQESSAQKKFREDIDLRLTELETRANRSAGEPQPPPATQNGKPQVGRPAFKPSARSATNDIQRYNEILKVMREKNDLGASIEPFQQFIKDFPESPLADNAQYWVAEGYFAKGDHARAVTEFQKVLDQYPDSKKVCDSILKQGLAFAELKDKEKATLFLSEVARKCPKTAAATKASLKLKELSGGESPRN